MGMFTQWNMCSTMWPTNFSVLGEWLDLFCIQALAHKLLSLCLYKLIRCKFQWPYGLDINAYSNISIFTITHITLSGDSLYIFPILYVFRHITHIYLLVFCGENKSSLVRSKERPGHITVNKELPRGQPILLDVFMTDRFIDRRLVTLYIIRRTTILSTKKRKKLAV